MPPAKSNRLRYKSTTTAPPKSRFRSRSASPIRESRHRRDHDRDRRRDHEREWDRARPLHEEHRYRESRRDRDGEGDVERQRTVRRESDDFRNSPDPRRRDSDKWTGRERDRGLEGDREGGGRLRKAGGMDSPNAASVDAKFGVPGTPGTPGTPKEKEKKFEKPKVTRNAPPVTFILVTVNDRLGTKAQVPCLASDTVRDFKLLVAAKIGRQPHEIMIKRQGQRPFKDNLTLDDYEVSNGVQLDLELSTGD